MPQIHDWTIRSRDMRGGEIFISESGNELLVKGNGHDLARISVSPDGMFSIRTMTSTFISVNSNEKIIDIGMQ